MERKGDGMRNRTAADIMTHLVLTLSPDTDIGVAMHALLKKKTPEAPVVDQSGKLVGMLSETDCLRVICAEAFEGMPRGKVSDYMNRDVETIQAGTCVCDIVNRFLDNSFRRLLVQDDKGDVVGLVSRRDLLLVFEAMKDNPRLYGTEDRHLDLDESPGVDRAMKRARAK
jgi:predicted transcriptional regulator